MTAQEVLKQFQQGFDCSQVVLMAFAEELGYAPEELARAAAGFGGGMFRGDTCGAVTGALMALGMRFGHAVPGDLDQKEFMTEKVHEFQEAFTEEFGTTICRELIGYDFSQEGEFEKADSSGVMVMKCPGFCLKAIEVVQQLIDEE